MKVGTAVVPVLLAGTTYFLGSILETIFRISKLYNKISDRGFESATRDFIETPADPLCPKGEKAIPELNDKDRMKGFKHFEWQRLVLQGDARTATAFSQAHRFQAEAKCYLHSAPSLAFLIGFLAFRRLAPITLWGAAVLLMVAAAFTVYGLVLFAINSEYRRWVQVLAFVLNERRESLRAAVVRADASAAGAK